MKKARRWAEPHRRLAQRASGLRDAADLLGVLVRLGLDGPSRLISRAQGYLGNALVGVDHLLQAVPHQITLNRYEVLHRAGPSKPVHGVDVLLQTVLDKTEHLLRDLLSAPRQNRAGLRDRLEVLRRT